MEEKKKYIIIGSGAGGATLARELSKKQNVTIIEEGKRAKKVGNTLSATLFYDSLGLLLSAEGIIIHKTNMLGGSTVVSCGNMVRSLRLQNAFSELGIDLEEHLIEAEQELGIKKLAQTRTAKKIMETANKQGYSFSLMPKAVKKCRNCGNCVLGCKFNSKWTALDYLDEAVNNGANIIDQAKVVRILSNGDDVRGVEIMNKKIKSKEVILGDVVILAAGGIGTPIILQNSGFKNAGKNLFCDLFNVTYGITKNRQNLGLSMPSVDTEFYESDGFILSPFMDTISQFMLYACLKSPINTLFYKRAIGIMTKIIDESSGRVMRNGMISKFATEKDQAKLNKGSNIAKKILINAGVNPRSIFTTPIRGAHPGGTAAIGRIVDNNLETEIKNLYVCDASVLPFAPGLPPILTIIALAKWLSSQLL